MKKELQDELFKKYPKILKQKDLSHKETCMYRGIECPDKWYDIIDILCEQIQSYVSRMQNPVIQRKSLIPRRDFPDIEALQIKEKFGELKFYVNCNNEFINGLIKMAESVIKKINCSHSS